MELQENVTAFYSILPFAQSINNLGQIKDKANFYTAPRAFIAAIDHELEVLEPCKVLETCGIVDRIRKLESFGKTILHRQITSNSPDDIKNHFMVFMHYWHKVSLLNYAFILVIFTHQHINIMMGCQPTDYIIIPVQMARQRNLTQNFCQSFSHHFHSFLPPNYIAALAEFERKTKFETSIEWIVIGAVNRIERMIPYILQNYNCGA